MVAKANNTPLPKGVVFLTDISMSQMDDGCPRKYWLNKLEAGIGIIKKADLLRHLLNAEVHNDLRSLCTMEDISPPAIQEVIDDILAPLTAEDRQDIGRMELLYRRLGWFAAFALFIEPQIRTEFESVAIDSSIVLDKDPLWVLAYPDRVLKRKGNGEIIYREYVPMPAGVTSERWLQSWHYNMRLHIGLAASESWGTFPHFGQVMGLQMGFKSVLDSRLVHPYVWGYHNKNTEEWTYTRPNGGGAEWLLEPAWAYPGGIVSWVRMCGESIARAQFPLSPNVFLNRGMLDAWAMKRVHREREIASIKKVSVGNLQIRDIYFGKVTSQCSPGTGEACPYLSACWDKGAPKASIYTQNRPAEFGEVLV